MKRTYNRIQRKRDRIDGRFDQLLGSLEMHRNVLLKDKIDTLWSNENKKHYLSLRLGIEKKKAQRAKLNEKLKETYKMMLNFVYQRKESQKIMPLETEGKFLDSLRLVCESGWVLNSKDFYQILNIIQVWESFNDQIFFFLSYFVDLMKFDKVELIDYFKENGISVQLIVKKLSKMYQTISESPKRQKYHLYDLYNIK